MHPSHSLSIYQSFSSPMAMILLLLPPLTFAAPNAPFVRQTVTVSKDGRGNFTTIQQALIRVSAGIYEEYISIDKKKTYLMMIGDGINKTIITGNHNDDDGWKTFNSATFGVKGDGFVGVNIIFRNTAGPEKHQAVAALNSANMSSFYSCSFEGYQDTLYAHSKMQLYRECDIYGTIDFIFGNAAAVFQNCNIYARRHMRGLGASNVLSHFLYSCVFECAYSVSWYPSKLQL